MWGRGRPKPCNGAGPGEGRAVAGGDAAEAAEQAGGGGAGLDQAEQGGVQDGGEASGGLGGEALVGGPAPEVRRRIARLLKAIQGQDLGVLRAVEVLERLDGEGGRRLLERLARGAAGARLTREADAALRRLRRRAVR